MPSHPKPRHLSPLTTVVPPSCQALLTDNGRGSRPSRLLSGTAGAWVVIGGQTGMTPVGGPEAPRGVVC